MGKVSTTCVVCVLVLLLGATVVVGDWDDGNPHVMHYPQLPNPYGLGVCLGTSYIADDFECSESGEITDLHFWYVWKDGIIGSPTWQISIYEDCGNKPCMSPVWTWNSSDGNVSTRAYGTSWLWWYCWNPYFYYDHGEWTYHQVNITDIENGFYQVAGTRYWIVLRCTSPSGYVGWLTTLSAPWGSRARYWDPGYGWRGLYDYAVNMSFVITKDGPSSQACCFEDGSCNDIEPEECLQQGGTPQGQGTNCGTVSCPQPPEACCFEDGTCDDIEPEECMQQGGMPQGPESTCATTYCEQFTEACCFASGWCDDLRPEDCLELFGTPRGPSTKCESVECPALSANKWEQLPDPNFAGVPASDLACYDPQGVPQWQASWVGDDWACTGGDITALRWWGYYRQGDSGDGILYWYVCIYEPGSTNPSLPGSCVYQELPYFSEVSEVDTGMVSSSFMNPPIYEYTYQLAEPFEQVEGQKYFLVLTARSVDFMQPDACHWDWQRHNISLDPILYPAVHREQTGIGEYGPWHPVTPDKSDMAFTIISECIVDFELYA
jgi:hypothetical protein